MGLPQHLTMVFSIVLLTTAAAVGGPPPRDQPRLLRLQVWDGRVVARVSAGGAEGKVWYALSPDKRTTHRLAVPGLDRVVAVASGARPLALGFVGKGLHLRERLGATWKPVPLPRGGQVKAGLAALAADGGTIVLLGATGRWVRGTTGVWRMLPLEGRPKLMIPGLGRSAVAIHRGVLYEGFARGEWGGDLLAQDLTSGAWQRVSARTSDPKAAYVSGNPVQALRLGPDGALWVAEGLAHLSLVTGVLRRFDGKAWSIVARSDRHAPKKDVGWGLPAGDFNGLDFDRRGRPVVLTGTLGAVRLERGKGERLTGWWTTFQYTRAMVTHEGTLVLGTYDAGLLVAAPGASRPRRVVFRGP